MPDIQETVVTVESVLRKADLSLESILHAIVILTIGVVIIRVLMVVVDRGLKRSRLHASAKKIVRGFAQFVFGFVLCTIVLGYLNIEITSLVALLSVGVFAVSLALQSLLSNVAGGWLLLSTKPYAIGDYIEVGNVAGTVVETGMVYTRLRTYDNKRVQVPNSQVTEEKIINYTAEKTRRVDVRFRVPYSEPVDKVKGAALGMLEAHPDILADPAPAVRVSGFMENSIEYFIRVWCENAKYWDVYFDVLEGVKAEFDRQGIEMAYNRLNVRLDGPASCRTGEGSLRDL